MSRNPSGIVISQLKHPRTGGVPVAEVDSFRLLVRSDNNVPECHLWPALEPVGNGHYITGLTAPREGRIEHDVAVGYNKHLLHLRPDELLRFIKRGESVGVMLATHEPDDILLFRYDHAWYGMCVVESRMKGACVDIAVNQDDIKRAADNHLHTPIVVNFGQ